MLYVGIKIVLVG